MLLTGSEFAVTFFQSLKIPLNVLPAVRTILNHSGVYPEFIQSLPGVYPEFVPENCSLDAQQGRCCSPDSRQWGVCLLAFLPGASRLRDCTILMLASDSTNSCRQALRNLATFDKKRW